jgi:uncharacterized protein with HEPN domain
MKDRVEIILEHMLEDATDVVAFCEKAGSLESFYEDVMIRKAAVMSLLNIGELASHLPVEYKNDHPEIPWKSMTGMRNFAAHGYHTMNLDTVWNTVQTSIPMLIDFLKSQMSDRE